QPAPTVALDAVDFGEDGIDVLLLLQQACTPVREQREKLGDLRALIVRKLVQIEQFADLGQGKPETLAAQNQLDAHALPLTVESRAAVAARRHEAAIFVKANGARRQREFARQIGDRIGGAAG